MRIVIIAILGAVLVSCAGGDPDATATPGYPAVSPSTVESFSAHSDIIEVYTPGVSNLRYDPKLDQSSPVTDEAAADLLPPGGGSGGISCSSRDGKKDCFCTGSCCRTETTCSCLGSC